MIIDELRQLANQCLNEDESLDFIKWSMLVYDILDREGMTVAQALDMLEEEDD